MRRVWEADVELGIDLAKRLIESQFPRLGQTKLDPLAVGWDNTTYLVDETYVFRFPHRKIGAELMTQELRILPLISPRLPLPVPIVEFVGKPDLGYPYAFAGYRILPGVTACQFTWTDDARANLAPSLGRFLRALHSIPISAETRQWARGDFGEKSNLPKRAAMIKERISLPAKLDHLVNRLSQTPPHTGASVWVHGDLYARHLMVNETGGLCGIIDFGDAHLGDPALDLSIAWSFLPRASHLAFRQAYGPIDDPCWCRARFRALFYAAALVAYGQETRDNPIRRAGEYALAVAGV